MDPRQYEPADDGDDDDAMFSPRTQLLSPELPEVFLQRPSSPAKDARRFSSRDPRMSMPIPDVRAERPAERLQRMASAPLDFRSLRRILRETSDQLDAVTKRANKAESHARDARARTFALEVQYQTAREASIKAAEELKLYKAELARAQQEVARAQTEINSLAAERDRAEADAAKSRDTARKAAERLKIQQAREEGLREGRELGRREGMLAGQSRAMANVQEDTMAIAQARANRLAYEALKKVLDEEDAELRGQNGNGNGNSRRTSVSSQDQLAPQAGPSRTGIATLTPIQEAAQEISPAQQGSMPLQMPEPHPAQPRVSAVDTMQDGLNQPQPGMSMPGQFQGGMDGFQQQQQQQQSLPTFQFSSPMETAHSPAPRRMPMGSPVPPSLGLSPGGAYNMGLGAPSFQAQIIPPTPAPASPAAPFIQVPSPQPAPPPQMFFNEPMDDPPPQPVDLPPAGFVDPSIIRAPSPRAPSRSASPAFMHQSGSGIQMPFPGTPAMRDAFAPVAEPSQRERKERKRRHRRQDSIGSVPLTITPASPEESESSSDDGGSHRTSRTSRRGPQSVGRNYLDPHHVPRPPSRRASPSLGQSGSRMSSPKVDVFDVATGGTIRVPSRVISGDILEQEARDREEAERRRSVAMSMGGSPRLPNVPDMTPGRRTYSPLPSSSNMPPLPPSISPGGGNRMSMYGGGSARSRTSNLPSYAAAPSEVPYPGPVSPMPRMSFPPSSGNSTITPVIPGMTLGGGYAPAPLDGGAMYPGPITPVGSSRSRPRPLYDDAGRSPSASVVQLIGPRAVSPGAEFNRSPIILPTVPPLSRAASPNPYDAPFSPATAHPAQWPPSPVMPSISPRPSAGATPFMRGTSPAPTHSRPPSRYSMANSMARTDRIRPHELPGTQTYEAAPGAPMYPPPPTPARVPIPPSPAMSRRSTRSHVTSADPPGELTGAIFTRPPGGFSWENR